MRILHYISSGESDFIRRYVTTLAESQSKIAEVEISTGAHRRKWLDDIYRVMPDVVHIHGCWHKDAAMALIIAHQRGFCTAITPHGMLEQWVIKDKFWSDKLWKIMLWQHAAVRQADAIHVSGRIESNCMKRLKWNSHVTIIANPMLTSAMSFDETASSMITFYENALNRRHTFYEMTVGESMALTDSLYEKIQEGGPIDKNEGDIRDMILRLRSEYRHGKVSLFSLERLATVLRNTDYDEDRFCQMMAEERIRGFAARIFETVSELTNLEEGYLPMPTVNDHRAYIIKTKIAKQLSI